MSRQRQDKSVSHRNWIRLTRADPAIRLPAERPFDNLGVESGGNDSVRATSRAVNRQPSSTRA
jgi:hypothetical protein